MRPGLLSDGATDVIFVTKGEDRGLYLNGHKVTGVMSVEPDLFSVNDVSNVTIRLHVSRFAIIPEFDEPEPSA